MLKITEPTDVFRLTLRPSEDMDGLQVAVMYNQDTDLEFPDGSTLLGNVLADLMDKNAKLAIAIKDAVAQYDEGQQVDYNGILKTAILQGANNKNKNKN